MFGAMFEMVLGVSLDGRVDEKPVLFTSALECRTHRANWLVDDR